MDIGGRMRILIILLFLSQNVLAQEVVIRDSVTTGYKAQVNKLGTKYGLGVDSTPATAIYYGQTTVSNAGTAVVLGSSTAIRSVCIKALTGNTGKMYVGDTSVTSSNGYELPKDVSICLDINNLNLVYINASVNGEAVSYVAVN